MILQNAGNRGGDVVLHRKDVRQLPIVPLGPQGGCRPTPAMSCAEIRTRRRALRTLPSRSCAHAQCYATAGIPSSP